MPRLQGFPSLRNLGMFASLGKVTFLGLYLALIHIWETVVPLHLWEQFTV